MVDRYEKPRDFKVGDNILVKKERAHHVLNPATITDIVYEEYSSNVSKGSKLEPWYAKLVELLDPQALYEVRCWKPTYVLSNGVKTTWTHQLYSLES